mmetsp:Transcript_12546/g.18430  ORF Transcript_12546/g.18430 Transcript_12546/m.18430 type:complete len:514 (-) Transcript_12546:1813-3354(-)
MPVDINLLRSEDEGGMPDRVLHSQFLRAPSLQREKLQYFLSEIRKLECELRERSNIIDHQRNRLKQLQKSMAPNPNSAMTSTKDKVKARIKDLKETIRLENQKIRGRNNNLSYKLFQIGNLVDAEVNSFQKCSDENEFFASGFEVCNDPVFCLGGYEKIKVEESLTFTSTSGILEELKMSFVSHVITKLKQVNYTLIDCPDHIDVSKEIAHSALGCAFGAWSTCDDATQIRTLPSFAAALMLHKGKLYFDRELPQGQVYLSTNQHLFDSREEQRISTFRHTKRKWFKEVKEQQIGLFGLTVCTLEESRRVQLKIVDQILELFSSLLVDENEREVMHPRHSSMLRTRSVLPCDLQPFEASRMLIEGFLFGEFVTLGFVSNCTDYISRSFDIRCGGAHVDFVHSVHATVCGVNEAMEWLVQNNVVKEYSKVGAFIPADLAVLMGYESEGFVPFRRYIKRGRRKLVTEELDRALSSIIYKQETNTCFLHVDTDERNEDEIYGERHMSRFNFLPFHS